MSNDFPTDQSISKREWMLVAFLLVLGGVIRILFAGSIHVEHFDEGVYASNRWFTPEEETRYPDRHLYAPPLWPAVLEYSQLLFGPTSLGVMLPGILCGTLAIAVLWRLLRCWVGGQEALLAAAILSVSGFHILFSRTALTDAPVTMLMLCGIGLGWSSLARTSFPAAIAAGLCTGLAWSVKYNGWFPLAVIGAGLAAATILDFRFSILDFRSTGRTKRDRRNRDAGAGRRETEDRHLVDQPHDPNHNPKSKIQNRKSSTWGCGLLMAVVAGVVWLPAWWDLQSPARGGYAAVAANHAGYVSGWNSWLEHFRLQFENMAWFDNDVVSYGFLALIAAFIVVRFTVTPTQTKQPVDDTSSLFRKLSPELVLVLAIYLIPPLIGMGFSLPRLLLSLALTGLGIRLFDLLQASRGREPLTPQVLAGWMALAWCLSLVLVTPLYRPYPRLALPLYFALLTGAAFGVQQLKRLFQPERSAGGEASDSISGAARESNAPSVSRGTKSWIVSWAAISLVISHALAGPRIDPRRDASPWQSRLSMETASRQIVDVCNERGAERLSRPVAYILYVYGEPALYYHLCRLAPQNVVIAPVSNLGFLNDPPGREPVPIYLVAGPHTVRNPDYLRQREAAGDRLAEVVGVNVHISDLLLLNAHTAREIAASDDSLSEVTIELLEMQPPAAGEGP